MLRFARFIAENAAPGYHKDLNPVLWDGDHLKPDVRDALLKFAKAWQSFAHIPDAAVKDVWLVGGSASHYYNELSDLDVHLIIDMTQMGNPDTVADILKDKKATWAIKHSVMVKGLPCEPYGQPETEKIPQGQGAYSLTRDAWVQKSVDTGYDPTNDPKVNHVADHWKKVIDRVIDGQASSEAVDRIKDQLSNMRSQAISRGGDTDPKNFAYKVLRNEKYLDKLSNYLSGLKNKNLSLI